MDKNIISLDVEDIEKNEDHAQILSFMTGLGLFSLVVVLVLCIVQVTISLNYFYNN